jgi:hypothetical protein
MEETQMKNMSMSSGERDSKGDIVSVVREIVRF